MDLGIGGFPSFPWLHPLPSSASSFLLQSLHRALFLFVFRPFIVVLGDPDFFSANRNWSRRSGDWRAYVIHSFLPGLRRRMNWGRTDLVDSADSVDSVDSDRRIRLPIYVLRQQTKETFLEIWGSTTIKKFERVHIWLFNPAHGALLSFLSFSSLGLCYDFLSLCPFCFWYSSFSLNWTGGKLPSLSDETVDGIDAVLSLKRRKTLFFERRRRYRTDTENVGKWTDLTGLIWFEYSSCFGLFSSYLLCSIETSLHQET